MLLPKSSRFAVVACTAILCLAAGCRRIKAPASPGDSTASKGGADIQVLDTSRLIADSNEHLTFASALPDGGFLAASLIRGGGAFVYKLAGNGSVVWRTPLPDRARGTSGGIASDGQYWLGGSVGDPNSDAVQLISRDGALSNRHTLARAAADRRFLICAAEREQKYFQIGSVGLDEYLGIPVSSISMTNADGARLWENLVPFDQGRRIAPIPQEFLSCAGIFLTGDRRVLAAQQILVWPETQSADEIQQIWAAGTRERFATLVLAVDLAGHEIARLRDDDTVGGLLVPAPNGAVLFETAQLKPGLTSSKPVDEQVHVRWLNSSLQDITSQLVFSDGRLDVINAAYMTSQGGLLLLGCSGTTARVFVRYVSRDRSISPKRELTQLGNCGGAYWFTSAPRPNEALLLSEAAPGLGSFVTTLRTSE
jgi:hypothetical protein